MVQIGLETTGSAPVETNIGHFPLWPKNVLLWSIPVATGAEHVVSRLYYVKYVLFDNC